MRHILNLQRLDNSEISDVAGGSTVSTCCESHSFGSTGC